MLTLCSGFAIALVAPPFLLLAASTSTTRINTGANVGGGGESNHKKKISMSILIRDRPSRKIES
jgi:hypothetical protein